MQRFVLGICGGSGSGKSYTVSRIKESFPAGAVSVLDQDSYYKDLSHLSPIERSSINFDHPNSIDFDLLASDLKLLLAGHVIEKPVYDFKTHTRIQSKNIVKPLSIIIIEGHHIFYHEKILCAIDHKVYLDIEMDIRFIRRMMRDINERGRDIKSVVQQYLNTVRSMDIEFIQPAINSADTVINSHNYEQKFRELLELLKAFLETGKALRE